MDWLIELLNFFLSFSFIKPKTSPKKNDRCQFDSQRKMCDEMEILGWAANK